MAKVSISGSSAVQCSVGEQCLGERRNGSSCFSPSLVGLSCCTAECFISKVEAGVMSTEQEQPCAVRRTAWCNAGATPHNTGAVRTDCLAMSKLDKSVKSGCPILLIVLIMSSLKGGLCISSVGVSKFHIRDVWLIQPYFRVEQSIK